MAILGINKKECYIVAIRPMAQLTVCPPTGVSMRKEKSKLRIHIWGSEKEPPYHPFAPARKSLKKLLASDTLKFYAGLNSFTGDTLENCDVLISYLDVHRPGFTNSITKRIKSFVKEGGRHVALHSGIIQDEPGYATFMGGEFTGHPPMTRFSVSVRPHPFTQGVSDFSITDEVYLFNKIKKGMEVYASTKLGRTLCPLGWTYVYGKGRVIYLALGHDEQSFRSKPFQQMLQNAVHTAT